MHQTLTIGRFTVRGTPDTLAAVYALQNAKPRKPRLKGERRKYPRFVPGMSTAEYVRQFLALNCSQSGGRHSADPVNAYPNPAHVDHLSFYATLNTAPAALPTGEETVEIIDDDAPGA